MSASLRAAEREGRGAADSSRRSTPGATASREQGTGRARGSFLWPSIITGLVLLSWCVARAPLRDMDTWRS
ncbi:MAG TPA: hypothetical protein VFR95_12505, partial [Gemmatimonadaceae bacterium]|nr:hypothetical protein [Gemmatimonadaceae bacterium]